MDIRLLSEEDLPAWAALLASSFDRSHDNMIALLKWQHAGWNITAYGAWDNNILAAQYSCLQMTLTVPDEVLKIVATLSLVINNQAIPG